MLFKNTTSWIKIILFLIGFISIDYSFTSISNINSCFIYRRIRNNEGIIILTNYLLANRDSKELEDFLVSDIIEKLGLNKYGVTEQYVKRVITKLMGEQDASGRYRLRLYSEVLDSDGRPTGRIALRDEIIHRQGIFHGSSNVAIFNSKGELLVQTRSPTRFLFPSKQTLSACGHVDPGESPLDAAFEESTQEIAVEIIEGEQIKKIKIDFRKEGFVIIGKEGKHDGYVKQYFFEYKGAGDGGVYLRNLETKLKKDKLLPPSYQTDDVLLTHYFNEKDRKWYLEVHLFNPDNASKLERIRAELGQDNNLIFLENKSIFNQEKKSFYVYILNEEEEGKVNEIMKHIQEGAIVGGGEVSSFGWIDFDTLLRNFQSNPQNYTDAFVPFFTDSNIIAEIRRQIPL
ncbi:MAG: NUDIX domain-containing protein [Candidatus Omnitrophica bacterium]|nr:NUDIX domain-containing protein [Candidatus Omnitrophota bacterium]